jgi:hypothetical protein
MARGERPMTQGKALRDEVKRWRPWSLTVEGKAVPGSVLVLRGAIAATEDPLVIDELLGEIGDEYLRAGLDDEVLLVQRERVSRAPCDVVAWLGLASALGRRKDGQVEAAAAARKGVSLARESDTLVRYALLAQARIARDAGESREFAEALTQLIAQAAIPRQEDCLLVPELVSDLPTGFCSSELVAEYLAKSSG